MTSLLDEIELDSARCFFAGREFNIPMLHNAQTVNCYFDEQWVEVDGNESGISVHQPTAIIHKADAATLAVGDTVTIKGTAYTVRDIQKDRGDTGDVLLVLSI